MFVVVFLDDILIFNRTWSDHLKHLDEILSALENQELYCKLSKCEFALLVVKFLGHVQTGNSLEPDPDKLKAGPPLDLSFWSSLTFLHHGIEEVERHLL